LGEILESGVVSSSDNIDIIGLLHFWAKNEGKKVPKSTENSPKVSKSDWFLAKMSKN
jgi:hypothetical protein